MMTTIELIDEALQPFNDRSLTWEQKYDAVFAFGPRLYLAFAEEGITFDDYYHDPDTSYEADVSAFVKALQHVRTRLRGQPLHYCDLEERVAQERKERKRITDKLVNLMEAAQHVLDNHRGDWHIDDCARLYSTSSNTLIAPGRPCTCGMDTLRAALQQE